MRPFDRMSLDEVRAAIAGLAAAERARAAKRLRRDPRAGARRLAEVILNEVAREEAEELRLTVLCRFEEEARQRGATLVAGVDEVGRGPLAGPVYAAAVVFPAGVRIAGVDDSKRLSASEREGLCPLIQAAALGVSIGRAEVEEIDSVNIRQASFRAMRRALAGLPVAADFVLVDGFPIPDLHLPQRAIVKGDNLSVSIAAASVIAKVARDAVMVEYDHRYPGYGFAEHKGYATAEHVDALRRLGPSPIHRRSFKWDEDSAPEQLKFDALIFDSKGEGRGN
ncbi:MAG: ribonuclease HII [Bacillota bacterium]